MRTSLGLAYLVATAALGCSSTTITTVTEEVDAGAGGSSGVVKRPGGSSGGGSSSSGSSPGGSSSSGGSTSSSGGSTSSSGGSSSGGGPTPPACASPVAFDAAAIELELGSPYKGPGPAQNACTQADLTQLEANFQSPAVTTFDDLKTGLSPSCTACAFSLTTDTRWGPIVLLASDPTKGFGNFGACYASINAADACGKAFQYDQFCANAACGDCVGAAEQQCITYAWGVGGPCAAQHASITTSCPQLAGAQAACGTSLTQNVKVVCGPI